MGWKVSCVFVSERGGPLFADPLVNDPQQCERLASELGFARFRRVRESTFEGGVFPYRGELFIGAYPGGYFIGHDSLWLGTPGPLFEKVTHRFSSSTVLALGLHSVTDFWAYALFEAGELKRVHVGAVDEGIMADYGLPLPEESEGSDGEELVFSIAARMTGCPLDQDGPHIELPMSVFTPPSFWRWRW
ncbi:MAG: hypothetical protein K2X03_05045 [Bryobacteraceae bacterium]|nr:hypothetical protein [Bryobacteraceae bacterium]